MLVLQLVVLVFSFCQPTPISANDITSNKHLNTVQNITTGTPSMRPTEVPSTIPTKSPRSPLATSALKTKKPSFSSSTAPTGYPTKRPTNEFTSAPTSSPTTVYQLPPTTIITTIATNGTNLYATTPAGTYIAPTAAATAAPTLGERRKLSTLPHHESTLDFTQFTLFAYPDVSFKSMAVQGDIIILLATDGSTYVTLDGGKNWEDGAPLPGVTHLAITEDSHIAALSGNQMFTKRRLDALEKCNV